MTTKVQEIGFTKLTNAEHLNFHIEVKMFIESCGAENISATTELPLYAQALEEETDMVNRQAASAITADLEAKDKERDELLSFIFATVDSAKNAPMTAFKEAHKQLTPVLSPYKGITKKTYSQESAEILGLLKDLRVAALETHVSALNLTDVLTLLETVNTEYMTLDQQRTSETPDKIDAGEVRSKVDDLYSTITDKINATVILMPNDSAIQLVKNINNSINETQASYNRRTAKRGEA